MYAVGVRVLPWYGSVCVFSSCMCVKCLVEPNVRPRYARRRTVRRGASCLQDPYNVVVVNAVASSLSRIEGFNKMSAWRGG